MHRSLLGALFLLVTSAGLPPTAGTAWAEAQQGKLLRAIRNKRCADAASIAIEACIKPTPAWMAELNKISEGQSATLGAYNRPWK